MMKSNDILLSNYLFFYIIYIIMITFSRLTSFSTIPTVRFIYKLTVVMSILINILFLFVMRRNHHKNETLDYIIIIITLFLLFLRLAFHVQVLTFPLLANCLFILNLRYINLSKFIKYDFYIKLSLIFIIIILYLLRFTPVAFEPLRNGVPRINAGFVIYNIFAATVLYVMFSYILLLSKKSYKFKYICLISIVSFIVYYLTQSRGLKYSSLMIISLLILHKFNIIKYFVKWILWILFLICPIISIIIPVIYNGSSKFTYFNKFFNNRLAFSHLFLQFYHIRLIGYFTINTSGAAFMKSIDDNNNVTIDNNYLTLILVCGIIGFIIFEYIFFKVCLIATCYNNYLLCVIFITSLVYMTIETSFYNIYFYSPIIYTFIMYNTYKYMSSDKCIKYV